MSDNRPGQLRPMMVDRRRFLQLMGAGGAAAFLAACGRSADTDTTAAPTTSGAAAGTAAPTTTAAPRAVELDFWLPGGSDPFCGAFRTVGDNFAASGSGISIREVLCGVGEDENFTERILASLAAGTPPDAVIIWSPPVVLAPRGAWMPLDSLMASSTYSQLENWPEGVLGSCRWDGQIYGLPATASSYAIFYNEELLESKGISSAREDFPKTWDDLKAMSAEFVEWDGDTLVSAGFIPPYDAIESAIWSATNGGVLYDADNRRVRLASDQNIEMLDYGLTWLNEQYKGDWVALTASGNYTGGGYVDDNGRPPQFHAGAHAALVNGFWFGSDIYGVEFDGWSRWNVAQFPVGPSGTSTASGFWPNWCAIPAGTPNPEAAFAWLDYLVVEGMSEWFSQVPDIPTNRQAPDDLFPQAIANQRGDEFATDITRFFTAQLEVAAPMWTCPVQDFLHDRMSEAINAVMLKTATPREALTTAQEATQAELDDLLAG